MMLPGPGPLAFRLSCLASNRVYQLDITSVFVNDIIAGLGLAVQEMSAGAAGFAGGHRRYSLHAMAGRVSAASNFLSSGGGQIRSIQ